MSPEAQRIALAEFDGFQRWMACGTSIIYLRKPTDNQAAYWRSCGDKITTEPPTTGLWQLPDYLNDLNAMHGAEAKLETEQHYVFRCRLWDVTDCRTAASFSRVLVNGEEHNRRYASATAAQRAEALLRAIGKWTEASK